MYANSGPHYAKLRGVTFLVTISLRVQTVIALEIILLRGITAQNEF